MSVKKLSGLHRAKVTIIGTLLFVGLIMTGKVAFAQVPKMREPIYPNITIPPTQIPRLPTFTMPNIPDHTRRTKKIPKYEFIIVFNNDSTIVTKTNVERILDSFIMIVGRGDNQSVVKPSQTKNVYRKTGKRNIPGTPFDRGWIFRINDGPIYVYSYFPDATVKYENIVAIQKNDGPIVLPTSQNLTDMIEPESKAYAKAAQSELEDAIRTYNQERRK